MLSSCPITHRNPNDGAVAIFARSPAPGRSKTRLIPLLGARGAAEFQSALISDVLRKARTLDQKLAPYVMMTGRRVPECATLQLSGFKLLRQRGADLGERLEHAFRFLLRRHGRALVVGTDSPELPARVFLEALEELRWCESVIGPSPDGGYYLVGLRRPAHATAHRDLFRGIRWGTGWALGDTMKNLLARGFSCSVLDPFEDADRPQDLRRLFRRMTQDAPSRRRAPATWKFLTRAKL